MKLNYFGYLFLVIFIIFIFQMITDGPYIFSSGTKFFVNIKDLEFDIKELNIEMGDSVVWTNYDQIRHTIINDDPKINNSPILFEFDKYEQTFNKEGIIVFKSSLYDNMDDMSVKVAKTTKGSNFYNEIFNNLIELIKNIFQSFLYYINKLIKKNKI
jgi:plastocyanin